jgi:hypothetical protein
MYHQRKAVAHQPLALIVMLMPDGLKELTPTRRDQFTRLREKLGPARDYVAKLDLPSDVRERQLQILDGCKAIIDQALDRGTITRDETLAFGKRMMPLVMANARDAGRAQIDTMHATMKKWRTQLPPEEWKRLQVVITGAQMPRKQNLATQYFAKLLGEQGEGFRIVYAESLYDHPKALNLLGTHLQDREVSQAFFGNDDRMEIDLMAEIARDYLSNFHFE